MRKEIKMTRIYLNAFYFTLLLSVCDGAFLGGTVSWKVIPNSKNVRLAYRISWEKGTGPCGPGCTLSDIGKIGVVSSPELSTIKWVSITGNTTKTIKDVNYFMTSISMRNVTGWEQGEDVIQINGPFTQPFTVALLYFPWINSTDQTNNPSKGYMETYIDTRKRNDTGQPNGSPFISLQSYIGIPFGCTSELKLPVEDPDDDNVRCRLAESFECGGACTNVPVDSMWIFKTNCTMKIHAFESTGYKNDSTYRLTLIAEDFPASTLTLGSEVLTRQKSLSRVPIQITLRVLGAPCNKQSPLNFVKPTPPNFSRSSLGLMDVVRHIPVKTNFYLQTGDTYNINDTEIIMSSPMHFNYSYFPDDQSVALNRSNVVRVGVHWQPQFPTQVGNQQFCVWGVDTYGITTDARCVTSIVGDDGDFCAKGMVTCENNGTCVNVFKIPEEKCMCTPGYRSKNCSEVVRCFENPCEHNGTCTDRKTGYLCHCPHGFTGVLCETQLYPCWSNPCLNQGTCINVKNSFKCLCSENYTGLSCENFVQEISRGNEDSGGPDLSLILPITAGAVLAVALVVSSFLVIKGVCKKTIRTPGKIKPDNDTNVTAIDPTKEW